MKPIKFSLRYPAVTLILTALVVMVGMHAFLKMQRTEDPTVTIRTGLPAASARLISACATSQRGEA